jgi:DUF971 family protein
MTPHEPSETPTGVEVDREHGLTLAWADGASTTFELGELRVNCPCAECRGLRERDLPVWPKPGSPQPLRIEDAELIGAWGITLRWNDGHGTGIFSWDLLRAWRESTADEG